MKVLKLLTAAELYGDATRLKVRKATITLQSSAPAQYCRKNNAARFWKHSVWLRNIIAGRPGLQRNQLEHFGGKSAIRSRPGGTTVAVYLAPTMSAAVRDRTGNPSKFGAAPAAAVQKQGVRTATTTNFGMTLPIHFDAGHLPTYN
jgi:hypothetical protein